MTWKVRMLSALVLGGLTLALLSTGAVAGGKIDKLAEAEAKEKAAQVQMLAEAYKMAEFGKEHHSPLTLITAGGILWKLQKLQENLKEQTVEEFKVEFDPDAPKEEVKTPVKIRTIKQQANDLFEQARIDGAGLPELEKLIKLAKDERYIEKPNPEGTRGSALGPQVINRMIPPGATHSFKIPFVAGLPAQFAFRSSGPCQVSLVNARNENLIGAGVVTVGNANWIAGGAKARGNIPFTVRVRNMAGGPVQYQILTN